MNSPLRRKLHRGLTLEAHEPYHHLPQRRCAGRCNIGASPKTELPSKTKPTKRAAIYTRVSGGDQHPETQLYDLRELAKQRRCEIVKEYSDMISGAKSKRPGLDKLLADAGRHRFDVNQLLH